MLHQIKLSFSDLSILHRRGNMLLNRAVSKQQSTLVALLGRRLRPVGTEVIQRCTRGARA
jgi:hypothetical protein